MICDNLHLRHKEMDTMQFLRLIKICVCVMMLISPSIEMSVRRRLDSLPTDSTAVEPDTMADEARPADEPQSVSPSKSSSPEVETPTSEQDEPATKMVDQILELLVKITRERKTNPSRDTDIIATGDPKVDELLGGLREPSNNSRAVWMALLNGLMSDGSLNELLGNFIQETSSGKRQGEFPGVEGQEQLEGEFADQLEGSVPETQMQEFTLEPHLGPAIMPFEVPEGLFVSFIPRRAFGVVNGMSRPAHGHGSFYVHRPPGLVDVLNAPAYGFLFDGYRRFQPGAVPHEDFPLYDDAIVGERQ